MGCGNAPKMKFNKIDDVDIDWDSSTISSWGAVNPTTPPKRVNYLCGTRKVPTERDRCGFLGERSPKTIVPYEGECGHQECQAGISEYPEVNKGNVYIVYHKTKGLVDADILQVMGRGPGVVMSPSLAEQRILLAAELQYKLRAFFALKSICKERKKKRKRKEESTDGAWGLWIVMKRKRIVKMPRSHHEGRQASCCLPYPGGDQTEATLQVASVTKTRAWCNCHESRTGGADSLEDDTSRHRAVQRRLVRHCRPPKSCCHH